MASADLKKKNTELETLQAELAAVKLQLAKVARHERTDRILH